MVTDKQVRRLFEMKNRVEHLYQAADLAGMSVKTARKYLKSGKFPSESKAEHTWKTHEDAFEQDWPWLKDYLENNHGIEAKALFEHLQSQRPGKNSFALFSEESNNGRRWKARLKKYISPRFISPANGPNPISPV